MIIGLVGRNAAGKTTIIEYLAKKGFLAYSLSDALRDEAKKQGIEPSRENLISLGNKLREEFGAGVLSEKIMKKVRLDRNCAIDSIRTPQEANVFLENGEFVLWFVDAQQNVRFERTKNRARIGDPKTIEEFKRIEEIEENGKIPTEQNLKKTISLAHIVIENNGSLDDLYKKVDGALAKAFNEMPRPSWDKYFMSVAKTVASRSNCVKRKVAAIVVKDKRIISTGYNGTPRGVKNCNEGGCPRCNSFAESGTKLDECICSHGEENAIVQASFHGVTLAGSTLYTTFCPCLLCAKLIINAGIKKVVYSAEYEVSETAKRILVEAKIELVQFEG